MQSLNPSLTYQTEQPDDDVIELTPKTEEVVELDEPKMFGVVFFNDNYTDARFVIEVVQRNFNLSAEAAYAFMSYVHDNGKGAIYAFTKDVAEMKSAAVNEQARQRGYPLTTDIEEMP